MERLHVYLCGCRSQEDDPPEFCPEHQLGRLTLTVRYSAGKRGLRPVNPVFREDTVEDLLRDLSRHLTSD